MTEDLKRRELRARRYIRKCADREAFDRRCKRALAGAVLCYLWALSLWAVALLAAR